ncbi:hypothetical protein WJX84_000819 [Apatococcus fuscideae]|uniref:Nuclear receptor corepressor 1 n=1 Tax=Apatococcus fuscideae TaxID=2026836 RepID=A0AAW1S162_9CHLO
MCRDASREAFLRPREAASPGRRSNSLRAISPRRSSFPPRGSEGWDPREGPPLPARALPMPPPLPGGNPSTPRGTPLEGGRHNPRSAPPGSRAGPDRPFRSPDAPRSSGSRDRTASDFRRRRASRSLSQSASPVKRRPDVSSPIPVSTLSTAQKALPDTRSSGRDPSSAQASSRHEVTKLPAGSLPGPPPLKRAPTARPGSQRSSSIPPISPIGSAGLPGASADGVPKRKRLGWGQGLKRHESHPVSSQGSGLRHLMAGVEQRLAELSQTHAADEEVQQQLESLRSDAEQLEGAADEAAAAAVPDPTSLSDAGSSSLDEPEASTGRAIASQSMRSPLNSKGLRAHPHSAIANGDGAEEEISPTAPDTVMDDPQPVSPAAGQAAAPGSPAALAPGVERQAGPLSSSTQSDSSLRHALARAMPLVPDTRAERLPLMARNLQRAAALEQEQLKLLPADLVAELSMGPGRALRPLATSPEELPHYQTCIDDHRRNRPRLFQKLADKRKALLLFQTFTALEYREKFEDYRDHLRDSGKSDSMKLGPEPAKSLGRSTSRSKSGSGAVRSDYEEQLIMSQLQAAERMRSQLMIQEYILDPEERERNRFISNNGRVDDPVRQLELEGLSRQWNDTERKHFHEQFMLFPKDFFKISHALKELGVERTTGECVAFYYRTQKLDEFANVRRKQQLKKRRAQSDLNRSVTYMGMSSARRGDVLVTSAVRATARLPAPAEAAPRAAGRGLGRGAKAPAAVRPPRLPRAPRVMGDDAASSMPSSPHGFHDPSGPSGLPPVAGSLPIGADRTHTDDRSGGWSLEEEQKFMEALRSCGKDMRGIAREMGTRSSGAVKSFFNKHRKRLQLDKILEARASDLAEGRVGRTSSGMYDLPTPPASAGPSRQASFSQAPPASSSRPSPIDPPQLHGRSFVPGDSYVDEAAEPGSGQGDGAAQGRSQATGTHLHQGHRDAGLHPAPQQPHQRSRPPLARPYPHHGGMLPTDLDRLYAQPPHLPLSSRSHQQESSGQDAALMVELLNQDTAPDASAGLQQMMAQYMLGHHLSRQYEEQQQQQGAMPRNQQQPGQQLPQFPPGQCDPTGLLERLEMERFGAAALQGNSSGVDQGNEAQALLQALGARAASEGLGSYGRPAPSLPRGSSSRAAFDRGTAPGHALLPPPHIGHLPAQQPLRSSLHPSVSFREEQGLRRNSPVLPHPLHPGLLPRSGPHQPHPAFPTLPPYPPPSYPPPIDPQHAHLPSDFPTLDHFRNLQHGSGPHSPPLPPPQGLLGPQSRASSAPRSGELDGHAEKREEKERGEKGEAARKSASSWQEDEKAAFMETYKEFGRDWVRLSEAIPDKTVIQIKNYYQNYKTKLGLDRIELPPTAIHPSSRRRRSNNQAVSDTPRASSDLAKQSAARPKSPPDPQQLHTFMSDVMAHLRQSSSTAGTQGDGSGGTESEQQQPAEARSEPSAPWASADPRSKEPAVEERQAVLPDAQEPPDSKLDSRDLQEVDEAPRPDPLKQPASRDGTPPQDGRSAAPKGDGPHLPAFLQPGHSLTAHLPAAPTLQASEDRFPHNPDLDPFLSSLQQSQQLMLSNVAEHRQPTNWDPPGQPASGLQQQALLDAALHREPGVGGPQMPFSEEEIRLHALQDHLATSGSFLFPGSLLPPFKTPRDQNRHPPVIETQAARAFDAALQGGRFHEEQQGSDHLPPPRHLFGSFLGQEHSEAARGRWAPQGPELESLRRAAEWMGGAAQQPSSQRAMHEGEADARGMQPGRAAASDISGDQPPAWIASKSRPTAEESWGATAPVAARDSSRGQRVRTPAMEDMDQRMSGSLPQGILPRPPLGSLRSRLLREINSPPQGPMIRTDPPDYPHPPACNRTIPAPRRMVRL